MNKYALIQGDCLQVLPTLKDESIDIVITSPPYNVGKDYAGGDEVPWSEWYFLIESFLCESYRVLRSGGVIAVNVLKEARWQRTHKFADSWSDYDPNYSTHVEGTKTKGKGRVEPISHRVYALMEKTGFKMRESIIWIKGSKKGEVIPISSNYQMGCDSDPYLRGCCEYILLGSKDRWYHDGGTGRRGKEAVPFVEFTKDVWVISPKRDRVHPAVFPKEIPRRLIQLFIHRANTQKLPEPIVLDPFVGSGTTLEACKELGVDFIGIDLDPSYCKLIKDRYFWQQFLDKGVEYKFSEFR